MTDSSKYNVWSQETRNNPHALYKQMRTEDPTFRVIDGLNQTVWFFTRYHDSVSILKDKRVIKNIRKNLPEDVLEERFGIQSDYEAEFSVLDTVNQHMLNQDPPDHTRLRGLVHKAFTPARVRDLKPRIEEIADDLISAMRDKPDGDLVVDFAVPLPITVICEILGVPAEDRANFRNWTQALLNFSADSYANMMEFVQYMNEMIELRRNKDTGDILSALVRVEEEGDTLDHTELLSMIFLLLVAGHETTVNLISSGTMNLLKYPDQFEKLKANPALIDNAVEEMLRYDGPVDAALNRWAAEPIEWADGRVIEPGDVLIPLLLGANRDPDVFENPDAFDITREPNPHIAFGHGIHYCLGAPLARMEGKIAIGKLAEAFPNMQLEADPDRLKWGPTLILHNLVALPMRYQ